MGKRKNLKTKNPPQPPESKATSSSERTSPTEPPRNLTTDTEDTARPVTIQDMNESTDPGTEGQNKDDLFVIFDEHKHGIKIEEPQKASIHISLDEDGSYIPVIVPHGEGGGHEGPASNLGPTENKIPRESESSATESTEIDIDDHFRDWDPTTYEPYKPTFPRQPTPQERTLMLTPETVKFLKPYVSFDFEYDEHQNEIRNLGATSHLYKPSSEPTTPHQTESIKWAQEMSLQEVARATNSSFQHFRVYACIYASCMKAAKVECPTCKKLLYCTDKHRRITKKLHESRCSAASRKIETKALGLHVIAARDMTTSTKIIQRDEPIVILPLNPIPTTRKFPTTYCLKCFASSDPDGITPITETKLCPHCNLPICRFDCISPPETHPMISGWITSHADFECKVFSAVKAQEERYMLIKDHSLLGLIRCIPWLRNTNYGDKSVEDNIKFLEMMSKVKVESRTRNFESKLEFVRTLLQIDEDTVSDEELYKIDQVLLRFGRNIGPDTVTVNELPLIRRYTRCIYPEISHVLHSCFPNCILLVYDNMSATLISTKEIKKGEALTFCYDERIIFTPTRPRRKFYLDEFGYACKCKRCLSPSELDTFFSSFLCSKPNCGGYIVPDNPLDHFSNWMCNKCKRTSISYSRILYVTFTLEHRVLNGIKSDTFGLLELMNSLVEHDFLHWNHNLIFFSSINLFVSLWNALSKNDTYVMQEFSKHNGLQFLKPVDTVINITQAFMPNGYYTTFILALRLASLIKLRHLADLLTRKETTLEKLNTSIATMYFRDITTCPLYKREIPVPQKHTERNLRVLEMKALKVLMRVIFTHHREEYKEKAEAVDRMYNDKRMDREILVMMEKMKDCVSFPWGLDV